MPPSKNPKWFFLNYSESVRFHLVDIGSELDHNGKLTRFLAKPIYTHIRNTPFPNGRKTMPCAGERCEACMGSHKPTKFFPIHIIVEEKEYVMDTNSSAHAAIVEKIDDILRLGTEEDVLNTEFQLTRLKPREKPYFVCTTVARDFEPTDEELESAKITENDLKILRALSEELKKRADIKNTRGSVILTLKKKYDWPDLKIDAAFDKYLDNFGFIKEGK